MKVKLFYLLLVVPFLMFGQIQTKVDSNNILIGDQIIFSIESTLENPAEFKKFNDTIGPFEILYSSPIDTVRTDSLWLLKQKYTLTLWDSGTFYIPSINMESKKSDSIKVYCNNTILTNQENEITDIKEPINVSISFREILPFLFIAIILILIVLLIIHFIKNREPHIIKEDEIEINLQPYQIAILELQKLSDKNLIKAKKIKEFHSAISEIIRRYIEDGLGLQAMELSSNEILIQLQQKNINTSKVKELFETSDLAKFAKLKPLDSQNKECLEIAFLFVEQTKPQKNELQ